MWFLPMALSLLTGHRRTRGALLQLPADGATMNKNAPTWSQGGEMEQRTETLLASRCWAHILALCSLSSHCFTFTALLRSICGCDRTVSVISNLIAPLNFPMALLLHLGSWRKYLAPEGERPALGQECFIFFLLHSVGGLHFVLYSVRSPWKT